MSLGALQRSQSPLSTNPPVPRLPILFCNASIPNCSLCVTICRRVFQGRPKTGVGRYPSLGRRPHIQPVMLMSSSPSSSTQPWLAVRFPTSASRLQIKLTRIATETLQLSRSSSPR